MGFDFVSLGKQSVPHVQHLIYLAQVAFLDRNKFNQIIPNNCGD